MSARFWLSTPAKVRQPSTLACSNITSVPSITASPGRRKPQQARAAQRRATFLQVAARLIGEIGYEAVTMTAIAERAGASIGTLYDYFPDKQCLTQALASQYAEEADEHWKTMLGAHRKHEASDLAHLLIEGAMAFVRERPAYLPLFGLPLIAFRSPKARQHLRRVFADAIQQLDPALTKDESLLKAQVVVELIKSMFAVLKQIASSRQVDVKADYKRLLGFYLGETRLRSLK